MTKPATIRISDLANPVLTPMESPDPTVELFTVALRSLGSTARGYLAKPKGAGPFPALVMLQWAGVYKLTTKSALDRAAEGWLVLNLSSHDMPLDQDSDPAVPRRYGDAGHLDRETSYFLNMYLRDVRAVTQHYMLSARSAYGPVGTAILSEP